MPLHFKKYLQSKSNYKGGKSKSDIGIVDDQKIYKLSSNENQLGASPKALQAAQEALKIVSEYPDRTDKALRIALQNFYKNELERDQFITTNSGVGNIELIINGFMEVGTNCIYSSPAFGPYRSFPNKVGGFAKDVPLKGENFELDLDGILTAIDSDTRLIFLTSPNNPTGTHIPKQTISYLIDKVPDHVLVVIDEVYYQYANAPDYTRALPYVQVGKNVIGINSFSKAYGLAGLRIGYSYSTPEIAQYLQQLRRPFMINSVSMAAAIAALDDTDFIKLTVALIHQEKEYLYGELNKLGYQYWQTQANFILVKPLVDAHDFEAELGKQGVMVRPVANFGAPGCVRVTIGTHEGNQAFVDACHAAFG